MTTFAPEFQGLSCQSSLIHIASDMNALNNASIQDQPSSKGFASFAFPEAKSSKTGVSVRFIPDANKKWYVFRALYGHAQQVADHIIEAGDYAYLAMIWKDQRSDDGRKHRILVPFMNLLFVYVTAQQADYYVRESVESRFTTYYYDHFHLNAYGQNPPLTVSSRDMEPLIRTTALRDEHVMEVDVSKCRFVSNDLVRVTDGPFEGVTGRVARVARQNRVVVNIEGLQAGLATAYIPPYFLEKISQK